MRPALLPPLFPLLACFVVTSAFAAEGEKVKVLDNLRIIDPKTIIQNDIHAKVLKTGDAAHPTALEVTIDYAKANSWPGFNKLFPPGFNLKKYSAIRFWAKGDNETGMGVELREGERKDGKCIRFAVPNIKPTPTWTQYVIPIQNFKRSADTVFKDGQQVRTPGEGEPLDDDSFANLKYLRFWSHISMRGTSTVGQFMLDKIELVEK